MKSVFLHYVWKLAEIFSGYGYWFLIKTFPFLPVENFKVFVKASLTNFFFFFYTGWYVEFPLHMFHAIFQSTSFKKSENEKISKLRKVGNPMPLPSLVGLLLVSVKDTYC